jgi:hypothetical protein
LGTSAPSARSHLGDELLDHLEVDVGLEQRQPNLAHRAWIASSGVLLAQIAEGALEPV